MNVKKYLKNEAQKNLQELETDGDREFLKRLQDSVQEKPPEQKTEKKRSKKWLWAVLPSVAACAVAVVLIVELVPSPSPSTPSGNDLGEVRYDDANFVRVDSNLTNLFGAINDLQIHITENQTVDVKKTYDSVSGDDLFYTMSVSETSDSAYYRLEARIVVNDKYEFDDFNITDAFVTESYPNYSVIYDPKITNDSNTGLNLVQCVAKINNDKYDIYIINYEEYSLENGTFLTVIDNLFDFS